LRGTSMSLVLNIGQHTERGLRPTNDDGVAVNQFTHFTLCLLADGMGGNGAGAAASQLSIESLTRDLRCRLPPKVNTVRGDTIIQSALERANDQVMELNRRLGPGGRCGSTIVVAVWPNDHQLFISHLGDSRVYRIRDGRVELLTIDDDVRAALLRAG